MVAIVESKQMKKANDMKHHANKGTEECSVERRKQGMTSSLHRSYEQTLKRSKPNSQRKKSANRTRQHYEKKRKTDTAHSLKKQGKSMTQMKSVKPTHFLLAV